MGAERDRALDPRRLKWKDLVTQESPSHTVEQEQFETMQKRFRRGGEHIRAANRPEDEWTRSSARSTAEETKLFAADPQMPARWAPSKAPTTNHAATTPAYRLHHVHAKSGSVLRRVPTRAARIIICTAVHDRLAARPRLAALAGALVRSLRDIGRQYLRCRERAHARRNQVCGVPGRKLSAGCASRRNRRRAATCRVGRDGREERGHRD